MLSFWKSLLGIKEPPKVEVIKGESAQPATRVNPSTTLVQPMPSSPTPSGSTREHIEVALGEGPGFLDYSDWTVAMSKWLTSHSSDDLQRARAAIGRAISTAPTAKHYSALGRTEEMAQSYSKAADAAIEALRLDCHDAKLREWLFGNEEFLAKVGDLCNPNRNDYDPVRSEALWSLIIAFSEKQKWKEIAYVNRGTIRLHALKRVREAVDDLRAALSINPNNQRASQQLRGTEGLA